MQKKKKKEIVSAGPAMITLNSRTTSSILFQMICKELALVPLTLTFRVLAGKLLKPLRNITRKREGEGEAAREGEAGREAGQEGGLASKPTPGTGTRARSPSTQRATTAMRTEVAARPTNTGSPWACPCSRTMCTSGPPASACSSWDSWSWAVSTLTAPPCPQPQTGRRFLIF